MTDSAFKPAWWLPNSHFQTVWPTLFRRRVNNLSIKRERFELLDGDFIDIDWVDSNSRGPIVIILHGLEGSIESPYAKGMLKAIHQEGWRGGFLHFRGCSGEHNRLERFYHSGDTADVDYIVRMLKAREPHTPIGAIGFSLGGNVLVKWLGETQASNVLNAAVAISVPFELNKAVLRINRGFSRLYQWYLLTCLRKKIRDKFQKQSCSLKLPSLSRLGSLKEFDDAITAPLHGFLNADDYYHRSSSRSYIKTIQKPTLLLQARDDPFMVEEVLPLPHELSSFVQLEITEKGGHVGFVSGRFPWSASYWLEKRVPLFLKHYL